MKRSLPTPEPVLCAISPPLADPDTATHRVEAGPIAGCVLDNNTDAIVMALTASLAMRGEDGASALEAELAVRGYKLVGRWADDNGIAVADLCRSAS